MSLTPKRLFNKIVKAIPTGIFKHKESINEAAIDIYLTATGVRPACIPFDGEVRYDGVGSSQMVERILKNPAMLDKLREIDGIEVLIGPYYDTGTAIVVINKKSTAAYKIIEQLDKIAAKYGDHRSSAPGIHVLMGKLLGYVCPIDLKDIYKQKQVYSIEYTIDNRTHMEVWCPIEKKHMNKALELLEKMNSVLLPLDKVATLNIQITKV